MLSVVEIGVVQPVGCNVEAVDAGQHAPEDHHFRFFGMGSDFDLILSS